jgi:hypothetical protein
MMTLKIINKLKFNKLHFKFNGNLKNHITFGRIIEYITIGELITLLFSNTIPNMLVIANFSRSCTNLLNLPTN